MTDETLYRRVETEGGRVRYEPVTLATRLDGMRPGFWLVHICRSGRSFARFAGEVTPDRARVLAALESMRRPMLDAMREANRMRPDGLPPDLAREVYEAVRKVLGKRADWTAWRGESMDGVVDAGLRALAEGLERDGC